MYIQRKSIFAWVVVTGFIEEVQAKRTLKIKRTLLDGKEALWIVKQ